MKIKCEMCGKKFNIDEHNGICPKCGQKNYSMVESKEKNSKQPNVKKTDGNEAKPIEIKPIKTKPIKTKKSKRSKIYNIVTIIEVAIIIMLMAKPIIFKINLKNRIKENRTHEIVTETIKYDDYGVATIHVDDCTIEITQCEFPCDFTLPEGYEIVTYSYKYVDNKYYNYYDIGSLIEVYAVTEDANYIKGLDSYNSSEYMEDDVVDYNKLIENKMHSEDGLMCFLVKEGTFSHLIVDTFSGTTYDRVLDKRLEIQE